MIYTNPPWLPCDFCGGIGPDCVGTALAEAVWERQLQRSVMDRRAAQRRARVERVAAQWRAA